MGKGMNTLNGKVKHTGSMYVEAEHKNEGGKKPLQTVLSQRRVGALQKVRFAGRRTARLRSDK